MIRPDGTGPERDPGEASSGARACADRSVSGEPQDGQAPVATEPGDMGSPAGAETAGRDPDGS